MEFYRTYEKNDINVKKKYDGTIYHYCSLDTFMSIISNSTLRASNIRKSNDYHEIISCMGNFKVAARKALKKFFLSFPDDIPYRNFYFVKDVSSIPSKELIADINMYEAIDTDKMIDEAINNDSITFYCVCFSEVGDLLSQWRGYAEDGTGFAIGFNEAFLYEPTDYCHYKYGAIEYNLLDVRNDLEEYIFRSIQSAQEKMGSRITADDYANVMFQILNAMVYNAVFYKDDSFQEEREHRLVYYPFGKIRNLGIAHKSRDIASNHLYYDRMHETFFTESKHGNMIRKPLAFSRRNNQIVSYVDFDFSGNLPYMISEIVLGPKNEMDDKDLRLFLTRYGVDLSYTKIRHSKASYR